MSLRCTLLPIAASLAIPVAAIAGSDATTGTDGWMPFDTGMDGSVNAVALHRGQLYAGGGFQTASGVPAARIARWDGSQWEPLPGGGLEGGGIFHMVSFRDWLVVAGGFDTAGGVPADGLARWDGAQWSAIPGSLFLAVDALAVHGDQLVVAGASLASGAMENIARWNGATWSPLGSGLEDGVDALGVHAGTLYAASHLPWPSLDDGIWSWNGSTWTVFEDELDERVYAFGSWRGRLIAAGRFQSIGGIAANRIAVRDGATWVPLGSGLGTGLQNQRVEALGEYSGALWAAGFFESAGGAPARHVARWDGAAWSPVGSGTDWSASAIATWGGALVLAGGFETVDDVQVNYIARWQADPVFGNGFEPD